MVSDTRPVSTSVTEEWLRIVECRQSGDLTTSEATIQLYNTLPNNQWSESALKYYIDLCTEIDAEHAITAVGGGNRPSHRLYSVGHADAEASKGKEVREDMSDEFETETDTDSSASITRSK
jgi:hypothetical protein